VLYWGSAADGPSRWSAPKFLPSVVAVPRDGNELNSMENLEG
jgi:hypothetical protein